MNGIDSMTGMNIPIADLMGRLTMACVCGGVIGFEREAKERPAGLRTHMLVALASALFTILTFEILLEAKKMGEQADPLRVIEAVTAGVAFLAAGAIIQAGGGVVKGLTTGAGLWATGALGVASGTGNYVLAVISLIFAFVILAVLRYMEQHVLETKDPPTSSDSSSDAT